MESDTSKVLKYLLKDNFEKPPFDDFEYELNSHPDFPTLKAISDTLEKFGIENVPVHLKPNELEQLDSPFLAYIKNSGQNELTYVKPLKEAYVEYRGETTWVKKESLRVFSSKFTGFVALLNLEKASLPPVNIERQKDHLLFKSIVTSTLLCFVAFIYARISNNPSDLFTNITSNLFLITKCIGLILSTALVIRELNQSSSLVDKMCKLGEKTDCNVVLESKFATIYGWLKWSDIGFVYFLSGLLLLVFRNMGLITLFSIAAAPYILVSLYQQIFVLKKLCPICLTIMATLIAEFSLGISANINLSFTSYELVNSGLLIIVPLAFYLTVKALILSRQTSTKLQFSYNRLKRMPEVITQVIKRENALALPESPIDALSFGSKADEALKVQVFLSLHCGHCGRLFSRINEQLNTRQKLKIDIFLNFDPKNEFQIDFVEKLLEEYNNGDTQKAWSSLGGWYSKPTNNRFMLRVSDPSEGLKKMFITTNRLMKMNEISSLPKFYIEGFEKSDHYGLNDYLDSVNTIKDFKSRNQKEMIIYT